MHCNIFYLLQNLLLYSLSFSPSALKAEWKFIFYTVMKTTILGGGNASNAGLTGAGVFGLPSSSKPSISTSDSSSLSLLPCRAWEAEQVQEHRLKRLSWSYNFSVRMPNEHILDKLDTHDNQRMDWREVEQVLLLSLSLSLSLHTCPPLFSEATTRGPSEKRPLGALDGPEAPLSNRSAGWPTREANTWRTSRTKWQEWREKHTKWLKGGTRHDCKTWYGKKWRVWEGVLVTGRKYYRQDQYYQHAAKKNPKER